MRSSPEFVAARRTFSDIEELRGVESKWALEVYQLGRGRFRFDAGLLYLPGLHMAEFSVSPGIRAVGSVPADLYVLTVPVSNAPGFVGGKDLRSLDVVIIPPKGELDLTVPSTFGYMIAAIPVEIFERQTHLMWGRNIAEGTSTRHFRLSSPGLRAEVIGRWRERLGWGMGESERPRIPDSSGEVANLVFEPLVDLVAPVTYEHQDAGRIQVARQAERFLRANQEEAIAVQSLIRHLGIPARTLHQGFREAFGTTPRAYFNALRLNSAREDLSRPRQDHTVTSVALRWGFTHFGWFSANYRRMFGETPSHTLRRRSGRAPVPK